MVKKRTKRPKGYEPKLALREGVELDDLLGLAIQDQKNPEKRNPKKRKAKVQKKKK